MKIIIIGAGWYGCYCAYLLQNTHEVILIEKNKEIFEESSYYNQNRLHLGLHYPRNYTTRNLCKKTFEKFKQKFNVTDQISDNYYLISKQSMIDFNTFCSIYKYEGYDFKKKKNTEFENIDGDVIVTNEEVINSEKSKQFFCENLSCDILLNKKVKNIDTTNTPTVIFENSSMECDIIIDCTYNFLNLSHNMYMYEKTISLLYKKNSSNFGAVTIMDGNFCSLYPHDINKSIYTLTDVEFTPLIKSSNIEDINNYELTDEILNNTIEKMENKICIFFKNFKKEFKYEGYFLSNKTKLISTSDTRECNIENFDNKLITVNCGKIVGIFELEEHLKSKNLI